MKDIRNNTIKIILMAFLVIMLVSGITLMAGCKGGDIAIDEETTPGSDTDPDEISEAEHAGEESTEGEHEDDENGAEDEHKDEIDTGEEDVSKDEAEEKAAGDTSQEDAEEVVETEEIPAEITEEIETADNYFAGGMYAEAAKEYRDAARMIGEADILEGLKEELLAQISQNHQDAENITETARMHHSNAMTLQYEKRFEEAKAELEAALEVYPKYQTAVDALDSLEALMGLE